MSKQDISGVVLLNKAGGMSSNKALQIVKRLYNAKKAGHTGSLDPLATGLLPICLGQATKVTEFSLGADKKYLTTIKLGEVTDTLDSEGEILERNPVNVSDADLQAALAQFTGEIKQIPPMYSALKRDGQPLYKLARKGEEVERAARDMTVYDLQAELLDDKHCRLQVYSSGGFYIRSLAHDLGKVLGCGAHVIKLHRTESKGVTLDNAVTLEQLEDASCRTRALMSIDTLLPGMPELQISQQQALSLSHGKATSAEGLRCEGITRFYTPDRKLFGLGVITPDLMLKTKKIFIQAE